MNSIKKLALATLTLGAMSTALVGCGQSKTDNSQTTDGAASTQVNSTKAPALSQENLISNVSYTIGYSVGNNVTNDFKSQGAQIDQAQLIAGFKAAAEGQPSHFTDAQMRSVMQSFQQQMQAQQQQKMVQAVIDNQEALLRNPNTPVVGPKDAKVAVIEFFDYQCLFCSKIAPVMDQVMQANPDAQFIFKEFPIFGKRWPTSQYAAEMGLAVFNVGGAQAYLKYHDAIYATGDDEGKLTNADIEGAVKASGVDMTKAQAVIQSGMPKQVIEADLKLGFEQLGIQGTPAVIVMPTSGANLQNTTVIPGYSQAAAIQAAIAKAQGVKND